MIFFACPRCNQTLKSPIGSDGKTVRCPACNKQVIVPDDAPEVGRPVQTTRPVGVYFAGGATDAEYGRAVLWIIAALFALFVLWIVGLGLHKVCVALFG